MTQDERYAELRKNRATWWNQPGKVKVSPAVLALKMISIPDNHPDPHPEEAEQKEGGKGKT